MPYYKDNKNQLYFLTVEDIVRGGELLIPPSCGRVSDSEAQTILNTPKVKTPSERKVELKALLAAYNGPEEREYLKGQREMNITNIRYFMAPQKAQAMGKTVEQVLASEVYYQSLLAEDALVSSLEAELRALENAA